VSLSRLFPHLRCLRIDALTRTADRLKILVSPTRRTARCPSCGRCSAQLHSRYERMLADLPVAGLPVLLRVRVRRFRCRRRRCPQRIFAERLPALADVRARRTHGQRAALTAIGFAVGGLPGTRLGQRLGLVASRATLLRLVRAAPAPEPGPARVLGVDDWALRKRHRYGSILVDLEQRRPIDLLADRTSATFATWLATHPKPAIISRDRGGAYAEGARQGAPDAVQVADRFHLLSNIGDTFERVIDRHHRALRIAAAAVDASRPALAPSVALADQPQDPSPAHLTRAQQEQQRRRARRLERYEQVRALHRQGMSLRAISSQIDISRKTARRFLGAETFPERAQRRRWSKLAPYEPYVRERWAAGCQNAHPLWQEVRARGFLGAPSLVRRYVAGWRTEPARHGRAAQVDLPGGVPAPQPTRVWSPRQARWALTKAIGDLEPEDQAYRAALLDAAPDLALAQERTQAFCQVVRDRDRSGLLRWLTETEHCTLPELRGFVAGIRRDQAAVEAALVWEWSNGQTEGQINRLKALKRQMYGRAKLDLLRQRFLYAA
jgi:transposase